jgi:uncharacterized protein DUF4153
VGQLSADGRWRWDGAAWQPVIPSPAWVSTTVRSHAGWGTLGAALAIGLLADQWLRTGAFGLAAAATLIAAAAAIVGLGRLERIESRVLAAGAVLFGAAFAFRASPWLLWPDLGAALLLLGSAAALSTRGSIFDLGAAELIARSIHGLIHLLGGVAYIVRPVFTIRGRMAAAFPIARGLVIAVPIAAVLAALLASADPVFASFFNLNVDVGRLVVDVIYVVMGSLVAAGLLRLAASTEVERVDGPSWRLGATEALVVLVILDAVFVAFALAQVLAATGAAASTLRNAGVTYSDYARSGFFQLLWVSGITLAVLILSSRISAFNERRSRLAFLALAEVAIALTIMIDVVAFRRLSLYEEAYGFTMLRLYSHVFAVWVGIVYLLLAADFMDLWRARRWFIGAAAITASLVLLGLNAVNPEAVVVAFNTNHAQTAHKIDSEYLSELSSDATPALLASRAELEPALQQQVTNAACQGPHTYAPPLAGYNWSDAAAAAARHTSC